MLCIRQQPDASQQARGVRHGQGGAALLSIYPSFPPSRRALPWSSFAALLPFLQLAYNAPTELAAGADGKVPFLYGLEGFDRAVISIFILGCPVRADQAPLKPAEQPAPHPIVVDRAFQQCQVRMLVTAIVWLSWSSHFAFT